MESKLYPVFTSGKQSKSVTITQDEEANPKFSSHYNAQMKDQKKKPSKNDIEDTLRTKNARGKQDRSEKAKSSSQSKRKTEKKMAAYEANRNIESIDLEETVIDTRQDLKLPPHLAEIDKRVSGLTSEFQELIKNDKTDPKEIYKKIGDVFSAMEDRSKFIVREVAECVEFVQDEMAAVHDELKELKRADDIESLKTVEACRNDLKKLWIRFKYKKEALEMRSKGNLPVQIRELLQRMNIKFDLGILPIETAYFVTRKFGKTLIPELTLSCTFSNSMIARKVKYEIRNFNSQLISNGHQDAIRYSTATNWSPIVWNKLRICMELVNHSLINKFLVTNEGLKVTYPVSSETEGSEARTKTVNVNNYKEIDEVRIVINDFNCNIPAQQVYTAEYFSCDPEARKTARLNVRSVEDDDYQSVGDPDENQMQTN